MVILQTTLARMLPDGVTYSELGPDAVTPPLDPLEARLVENQVVAKRREFALGRGCARQALRQLGWTGGIIGRTPDRAPAWPFGFLGSITHTSGYAAAIAARRSTFRLLGLDAERAGGVGVEIWDLLFTAQECDWLATLSESTRQTMATVLFSAKESYFKAVHPVLGRWIDFKEIALSVAADSWLAKPVEGQSPLPVARGRYQVAEDLVVTCLCVPA